MSGEHAFDHRYDVLVVGARPAGAATAMLLARAGLKVLAIDRQAYGSDTLSTHALMRGAVMQLAHWGLLDDVVRAGTPAIRRTTFHYGDEAIGVDIKPGNGVNALFAPRRTVLDRALVDGARAAGAHIRHGAALIGLDFGRLRRVSGASIHGGDGVVHSVVAGMVIGADGRHSAVAKSVEARVYRKSAHRTALIYGYFSGLKDEGFRWYYRPGVSVGVIPTNGGDTCVFVSLPPERFGREIADAPEALFDRVVAQTSSDLSTEIGRANRQGRLLGFPGEQGYFRQSFGPGWALVGDAAYFKDPLTAHGITDALRDAELLARAVADGSEKALEHYQKSIDMQKLQTGAYELRGDLYEEEGKIPEALQDFETWRRMAGDKEKDTKGWCEELRKAFQQGDLQGYWQNRLDEFRNGPEPNAHDVAICLAHLGRIQEAYDQLDKMDKRKLRDYLWADICLDRSDPRFQELVRKTGVRK
jgi:2-polyprenyl-6-methoxyphenol hydroxylase-like FAD-dependent oxidoreductase